MTTNFLHKELVRTFFYDNKHEDREFEKEVKINGRAYYKQCVATVTTLVGNLYKVYDQSDKRYKYCLIVGMARQHPYDKQITHEEGVEVANVNALTNPSVTLEFDHEISWLEFRNFAQWYIGMFEPQTIKTEEEIIKDQERDPYGKNYPEDVIAFKLFNR